MKTVGIFTTNKNFIHDWIEWTISHYNVQDITTTKQFIAKNDICVEFSNGDCYRWIRPNSRGQKVTDAIIDIATCSCDEISTIILPLIINFEREPKITIVDSHSDKKYYDIDTLIDRLEKIRLIKGNIEIGYDDSEWGYTDIGDMAVSEDGCLILR